MGGSESLERYLWTLTCDTVHYNREEICRRINDEIKLENSWLVELYANGSVYMMPKNNKEKEKANYNLFCLYDDLCTELTQGGQPDDIDGYSEEI